MLFRSAIFALDVAKGTGRKVCAAAQHKGLLIRPLGDTVYLVPPLVTTEKHLRKMLDIVYDSIQKVTR